MSSDVSLLSTLFGDAAIDAALNERARLQGMLDFEAALARAEARCGVIPRHAVAAIESACAADLYDIPALAAATALAGNPAIALVRALTAEVASHDAESARWVHWGATSQDAIDTGGVLQLRDVLDAFEPRLDVLIASLRVMADRERATVMPGRTLLQAAVPVTLGLKAAGWLDALSRSRVRLSELRGRALALQFGGAAGTLASLHGRGLEVAQALADDLGLSLPALPWHSARDRIAETGAVFGLIAGTLGKIARDIVLLMQTEIGEAFEPAADGKGGSSAMPHKRNPVACLAAIANATRVPGLIATLFSALPQEHERGVGGWHAEWDTLPQILRLTAGSLSQVSGVIDGLELDRERMRAHLDIGGGSLYAEAVAVKLSESLGKQAAHQLVESAAKQAIVDRRHLRNVLAEQAQVMAILSPDALTALFAADSALGMNDHWIDRAIRADEDDALRPSRTTPPL
ncbi:3-carboxy-cis,cis-muconate cycloisomerase [Lysobacter sp. CA199]|uniref:3-carboxy-cis,cis-muconate cycloisomerase n=1 Tax=Lysobacter sp. CA199 TaxID=3455608 RepID=UPI003F8D2B9C